jgi:hypothetical protein
MAGDWLKMRHDLADDPAVIRLAAVLCIDEDAVLGKLFRLWCWADRHTRDGVAAGIGTAWVDRLTRCDGFGSALVAVGWLVDDEAGLSFPRFDRHCSSSAKERAADAARKAVSRGKNDDVREMSGSRPDKTGTREEKRRVPPPHPREASPDTEESWATLRDAWNAPDAPGKPWRHPQPPDGLADRLREPGWFSEAVEAIPRLRGARFFATPVTLIQFAKPGFVERLVGGQYDEPKAKPHGTPGDRPSVDDALRRVQEIDRRNARGRREYLAAKEAKVTVRAPPPPDDEDGDDWERRKAEVMRQLQETNP